MRVNLFVHSKCLLMDEPMSRKQSPQGQNSQAPPQAHDPRQRKPQKRTRFDSARNGVQSRSRLSGFLKTNPNSQPEKQGADKQARTDPSSSTLPIGRLETGPVSCSARGQAGTASQPSEASQGRSPLFRVRSGIGTVLHPKSFSLASNSSRDGLSARLDVAAPCACASNSTNIGAVVAIMESL